MKQYLNYSFCANFPSFLFKAPYQTLSVLVGKISTLVIMLGVLNLNGGVIQVKPVLYPACPACLLDSARFLTKQEGLENMLYNAQKCYKKNPEKFYSFLAKTDSDGWSPLMHYAADGNEEAIRLVIKAARGYFKNDHKPIIDLFLNRDKQGRNALYIAALRQRKDSTKALMEEARKVMCHDENAFIAFLTAPEKMNGWTPLIIAAYNDSYYIMEEIVKNSARVLGSRSKAFHRFINQRDMAGVPASFYSHEGAEVLKRYDVLM